jgi:hypothetical protein
MSKTTVAIVGVTGKFARLLTNHLLSKPSIYIHGICRSPSKVSSEISSHPRVSIFQASSNDIPAIRKGLQGSSVTICCYLGDNELMEDGQKDLIDASIAEGVPRYIAADWSLDFRALEYGQQPVKDPMKRVAEYLDEKKDQIKAVHILNGVFMEIAFSYMGLVDPFKDKWTIWGTGNEKLDMTTYSDAAAFTAEVAADPSVDGWIEGK